jgi:predicted Zn-dependent peptidase
MSKGVNIAFQTCHYWSNEKYVLNFLADILCNLFSSRLYKLLRQDYGLVYSIHASTSYYECGGDLTIATQFNASSFIQKNKPSVLPLIIKELNKLIKTGVSQSELTTCKHNIRGRLLLGLEDSDTKTNHNGYSLLYQSPTEIVPYSKEYKTYYEPITKAQVNACIRKYFCLDRMCVSVIGDELPSHALIEQECDKLIL